MMSDAGLGAGLVEHGPLLHLQYGIIFCLRHQLLPPDKVLSGEPTFHWGFSCWLVQ